MNGIVTNTANNFERLREDINSGRDRINAATQVVLDNAETISRLNDFEDQLQKTLAAMQEQITREVVAQSEESLQEQISVLAGAIGLRQADLDQYENELRVGVNLTLPVITKNQIEAFRAYAKGADDRRSDA